MRTATSTTAFLAIILTACSCAGAAVIVHGKVKVECGEGGQIKVFYGDREVLRQFYVYCQTRTKPRIGYYFPAGRGGVTLSPRIVQLCDKDGKQTGSMVTYRLRHTPRRMSGLSKDPGSVVRLFISADKVAVQMRIIPKDAGLKSYGEIGFHVPAGPFAGGRCFYRRGATEHCASFPPPDKKLKRLGGSKAMTLETVDGLRMRVSLRNRAVSLRDHRHQSPASRKNTWRIVTGNGWALDDVLTIEFSQAGASKPGNKGKPGP